MRFRPRRSSLSRMPSTTASPEVGRRRPVSILIVVLLPAPFGPRKPKNRPRATRKERWSTAVVWRKTLVRPSTTMASAPASMRSSYTRRTLPFRTPCRTLPCALRLRNTKETPMRAVAAVLILLAAAGLSAQSRRPDRAPAAPAAPPVRTGPPAWAADAVWYQVFVERFRNRDPRNDPTPADLRGAWPHETVRDWHVSPWTSDWYLLQPWEKANGHDFYWNAQVRRYGGDLQGLLDRLEHIQALGVNAIYLNPVF